MRLEALQNAVIMLSMLLVVFRHDAVTGRHGIARQALVFFLDLTGRAAHAHIGTIAVIAAVDGILLATSAPTRPFHLTSNIVRW